VGEAMRSQHLTEEAFAAMRNRVGERCTLPDRGVTADRVRVNPASRQRDATGPSPYRSKWEAAYASKLDLEKAAGFIKAYWYEPFSLWLPGKVRFKPDFLIESPYIPGMERHLEIVEVKGFSKNRRDGITRLKIAAALFPCFVWRLVWMKRGGGFDGEYV
jgi:hypothetical protein